MNIKLNYDFFFVRKKLVLNISVFKGTYSGCCKLNQSQGARFHELGTKTGNGTSICDNKMNRVFSIGRLGDGLNLSLMDLLEDVDEEEEDDECGISQEEIQRFQSNLPQLNQQREQLR